MVDGLNFSKDGIEFQINNFEFVFNDNNDLIARHTDSGREIVFERDGVVRADYPTHSTNITTEVSLDTDEGMVLAGPVDGENNVTGEGVLKVV